MKKVRRDCRSERIGEECLTKQGYKTKIIEYYSNSNCTVEFECGLRLYKKRYLRVVEGSIEYPFHPTVCGKGYLGIGKYKSGTSRQKTPYYNTWDNVLKRCYDEQNRHKNPTYVDATVCDEWLNFQTFSEWYEDQYKDGFHLDKDILFKGNKLYSPETCCFVPQEVNSLFVKSEKTRGEYPIGVVKENSKYRAQINRGNGAENLELCDTPEEAFQAYKVAKEEYIKVVADRWKPEITPECYEALYNYQVEITD